MLTPILNASDRSVRFLVAYVNNVICEKELTSTSLMSVLNHTQRVKSLNLGIFSGSILAQLDTDLCLKCGNSSTDAET